MEAWFADKDTKDYTAVVVMPTGSGKTGIICCLPYHIGGAIKLGCVSESEIDISKPVLVIAPGIDILHQLKDNLELSCFLKERGFFFEGEEKHNYSVFTVASTSDVKELQSKRADIILSNAQKWRKMKDGTPNYEDLPNDIFSMVIVDEAHHLPADQWEEIVKKFRGHAKIVFFTATPFRCDGKPITTDGAINAKGYAYELKREEAIRQRWIREVKFTELGSDVGATPAKRARKAKKPKDTACKDKRLKHAKEVLEKVIQLTKEKNGRHPLPGGKKHTSLIITKYTTEADEVKDICTDELGFDEGRVVVIHNNIFKTDKNKRREEMQKIRDGEYEIVIIVNMLREGFDYPPFSIAGIVTNIVSFAKFAQFVGRIQRVVRHEGEQEADIVGDIVTHEYFDQKKLYDRYQEYRITEKEDVQIDDDICKEIWELYCNVMAQLKSVTKKQNPH